MTLNNDTQLSIFDIMYPQYKITKPIRLIELFSGYGSQALALKYLGVPFEHWKTCEWAIKSIQAYKDIHFTNENKDYTNEYSKEDLATWLSWRGISNNYNEPMEEKQISKLSYEQLKKICNNIITTRNLVNIQIVTGEDLQIVDTDKYDYIMTYSFPCQDLSLAGKGKGMSDTSTRSGMLWEVERILTECNELGNLPQILLMENVPQVHSEDNKQDFFKWQLRLEQFGYKNYVKDLIATDYGIPQTRNRCFMVSILGDYSYQFPKPKPLKLKLKDMLENNVDEKYYLSDKQVKDIQTWNSYQKPLENMEQIDNSNISPTLTTRSGAYAAGMVLVKEQNMKTKLCNDLIKQGKVQEYDVIRHSYTTSRTNDWNKRSVEQNNLSPTLDTRCDCLGVVTLGNYSPSNHNASRIVDKEYSAPAAMENHGTVTAIIDKPKVLGGIGEKDSNNNTQWKQQNRIYDDKVAISVTTSFNPYYKDSLRIRKLTPKECFRLMGVKDEDYEKCAKNQSDSSLYHLAGDSIVVNVLMAIFKELL